MRQTLMLATMALMTACGATGNTPWDQNHDGLITACEGLNAQACDATPGCEHAPVFCQMICRDDGQGGCLNPCLGADLCRPVPPTPAPLDCSQLSTSTCANTPACEVVQQTICTGATEPVDPTVPRCGVDLGTCTTSSSCAPRAAVQCEQLDSSVCLSRPGCALEGIEPACANACDPDGACPPCAPPQLRCVTQHPSLDCGARDPNVCAMDGRCVLEQGAVCDAVCDPDGSCPPCANPSLRCVPAPLPDLCGSRDLNTCSLDGRCVIEPGPVCLCSPEGICPPCAEPSQRCVAAPPPDECGSRDLNTCSLDGRCVLEQGPVCEPACDPDGSCPPCANPSPRCVPAYVPDVCAGRDPASCEVDGRCTILAWACTAECRDDGNGGCLPCDAPPAVCVPVASRCEGLQDRTSCQAAGCEVIDLGVACTTDCRDDGHGGCLPCKDFVCSDGSTSGSGGTGGGTPPPQP